MSEATAQLHPGPCGASTGVLAGCLGGGSCLMGADSCATGTATEMPWHLPETSGRFWTVMCKIDSESWGGWPLVAQHGLR